MWLLFCAWDDGDFNHLAVPSFIESINCGDGLNSSSCDVTLLIFDFSNSLNCILGESIFIDLDAPTVRNVFGDTDTVGDGVTMPLCNRFTILDGHVLPDVGINSLLSVG